MNHIQFSKHVVSKTDKPHKMLSFQNFHFCLHLGLFQFMWLSGVKMTVTNTCVTTSIYINICFISIKKPTKFIEQFCTYQSTTVTCPSTWIKVKFTDTNDEFLWKHTELYTKRIEKRITKVITTFKSTHNNNNTHVLLVHKITCCFNCTLTHLMHLSSFSPTLLYMPPLLLFCFYEAFQKINKQNNWSSPEASHGQDFFVLFWVLPAPKLHIGFAAPSNTQPGLGTKAEREAGAQSSTLCLQRFLNSSNKVLNYYWITHLLTITWFVMNTTKFLFTKD